MTGPVAPGFLALLLWMGSTEVSLTRAADAPSPKRKILFFCKSSGFEHSVIKRDHEKAAFAEKMLADLGPKNNFEFTFSKDGSLFTPAYLDRFDAYFFYTTGDLTTPGTDKQPPMTKEGKAAFLKSIQNGKGFIGTHSAADTFHSPGNEDKKSLQRFKSDGTNIDAYVAMIGGEFIKHGAEQNGHLICADPKFPGLATFPQDFAVIEEWYSLKNFATNLHVLLIQDTTGMKGNMYQRPAYPAAWARLYGKGRVFYTNLGHREDVWTNPVFQQALIGGLNWAVGNAEADVAPNIDRVTPNAGDMPPAR
jgi:type 1 glutamine amidotransferase